MEKHTISFRNAFRGIWTAVITQINLRIHFLLGSLVLLAGVYFKVAMSDLLVLVLTIMVVMLAEMVNTAVESACNAITTDQNPHIKVAKDVAAGAVLLSAIFAIIVAFMIFAPKLYDIMTLRLATQL